MKRLLSLLLLFLTALSLYSADITFSEGFPEPVKAAIAKALDEKSKGRGDLTFQVSSFSEDKEVYSNAVLISFILSFEDKSFDVVIPYVDEKQMVAAVEAEIESILFYEPSFVEKEGERLDYIYKGSYSFFPEKDYPLGTSLVLMDEDGQRRGVFEVQGRYGDAAMLSPIWLNNPYPGMSLERGSNWRYSLSFASSFTFKNMIASAELGYRALLYPFMPKISFVYSYENGKNAFYGGIGVEAFIELGSIFSTSFTLIEEGRIGAGASILLGSSGGFKVSAASEIFYEHWMLSNLNWRVGYKLLPGKVSGMMLSIGGTF